MIRIRLCCWPSGSRVADVIDLNRTRKTSKNLFFGNLLFTNLSNILEPRDRVLFIFGAGHLGLLWQALEADPRLRLSTIEEFVL